MHNDIVAASRYLRARLPDSNAGIPDSDRQKYSFQPGVFASKGSEEYVPPRLPLQADDDDFHMFAGDLVERHEEGWEIWFSPARVGMHLNVSEQIDYCIDTVPLVWFVPHCDGAIGPHLSPNFAIGRARFWVPSDGVGSEREALLRGVCINFGGNPWFAHKGAQFPFEFFFSQNAAPRTWSTICSALYPVPAPQCQSISPTEKGAISIEQDWVLPNVLERGTLNVLFGAPESGKTFLAIAMASAVATGGEWCGVNVAQAPVLYVAGEGDKSAAKRFQAWAKRHEGDPNASLPVQLVPHAIRLDDEQKERTLAHAVLAAAEPYCFPVGLVVIDTLAANSGGANENDNDDMNGVMSALQAVAKDLNLAVLLVHHNGTSGGKRVRGASAITASADCLLYASKRGNRVSLEFAKRRDYEAPEPAHFRIETVDVPTPTDNNSNESVPVGVLLHEGDVQSSTEDLLRGLGKNQRAAMQKLLELLYQQESVTVAEWKLATGEAGIPAKRFNDIKGALLQRKLITVSGNEVTTEITSSGCAT